MTGGLVIGLTDRERTMHAVNLKTMAEAMLNVSETLQDTDRDFETMMGLIMIGMQANNLDQLLKAIQSATGVSDLPDDPSGVES